MRENLEAKRRRGRGIFRPVPTAITPFSLSPPQHIAGTPIRHRGGQKPIAAIKKHLVRCVGALLLCSTHHSNNVPTACLRHVNNELPRDATAWFRFAFISRQISYIVESV